MLRCDSKSDHSIGLFGKGGGCLKCAVAASDNQNMLVLVLFRLDETVNHLWQMFSRYSEPPGGAAPAHC